MLFLFLYAKVHVWKKFLLVVLIISRILSLLYIYTDISVRGVDSG